jgi:hypothetical protein
MKQRLSITIRGKQHEWNFDFEGDPRHLAEWREDGLVVDEIYATIPVWMPSWLMRPWIFMQDIYYFRNPFKA